MSLENRAPLHVYLTKKADTTVEGCAGSVDSANKLIAAWQGNVLTP